MPSVEPTLSSRRSSFRILLAVGFLSLAGLLLRSFRVTHQSFWNDEILTINNAGGTLLEVLSSTRDHNILPLYYLTIRPFLSYIPAELWLRFPSVLFGTLTIPTFYLLVQRWGGPALGLTGAALLALSPLHVWYSQEARPYALLVLLCVVALYLVQLAVDRPSAGRKAAAAITAATTFYCHTIALGFLLVMVVYVLVVVPRRRWKEWLPVAVGTALLIVPGMIRLFLVPPVGSADVFKPVTVWSLGYIGWAFGTGYSLGPTATEVLGDRPIQVVTANLAEILLVGGFLGALLVIGAGALRRTPVLGLWVTAWLLLPAGFALAGAMGTVHPLNVRYAIVAFPAFLLLLGAGLQSMSGRRQVAAWVVLAGINLWSLHNYFFEERYSRDDNRSAGRYLTTHARAGDLVIATAGYTAQNLRYYYAGPPLKLAAYPGAGGNPTLVEGPDLAPVVVGARYINPQTLAGHLTELTAGRDRIWLFASRTYHSDPDGLIARWLDNSFCQTSLGQWAGVELRLYLQPRAGRACRGRKT